METIVQPSPASRSLNQLEEQISTLAANINAATCRWLKLIAEFDRQDGYGASGCKSTAHWLNWKCGITLNVARSHVRVARALEGLPLISASFEKGELSFSKVRAMVRVADADNEDYLMMIARHGTASHLEAVVRGYRRVVRGENDTAIANELHCRRSLHYFYDEDGSLVVQARLDPEQGQAFVKAIEAGFEQVRSSGQSIPRPTAVLGAGKSVSAETLSEVGCDSGRDAGSMERAETLTADAPYAACRADALNIIVNAFLDDPEKVSRHHDRHQLVIHVDQAVLDEPNASGRCEFEGGPPMAVETLKRLSCDATVVRVVEDGEGKPLSVGRKRRTVPAAIARALQLRDRGCRFPGCTSTHQTDAHHIQHWSRGGETKMDNLVSLCRHHHRLLHEGGFMLEVSTSGRINFYTPSGNRLFDSHLPRVADTSVEVVNQGHGVQCGRHTATGLWQGEQMDLGMAVDGLTLGRNVVVHGLAGCT